MKVWDPRETGRADGRRPKRVRQAPEKIVQRACTEWLHLAHWTVYDLSQPRATMQTPGLPDLLALKPLASRFGRGGLVLVECKAGRNGLTAAQTWFRDLCYAAGVHYVVAHSAAEWAAQLAPPGADAGGG